MSQISSYSTYTLFLLNLCLQLFDGLATYRGMELGWQEGNVLLRNLMMEWGVGWTLLGIKAQACTLLLLLYHLQKCSFTVGALAFTAACYFSFSFIPWIFWLLFFLL